MFSDQHSHCYRKMRWGYYLAPHLIASLLTFAVGFSAGWIESAGGPWCDFGTHNWNMIAILLTIYLLICTSCMVAIIVKLSLVTDSITSYPVTTP